MPRCPQDLSFSRFKPFYKTICIILKAIPPGLERAGPPSRVIHEAPPHGRASVGLPRVGTLLSFGLSPLFTAQPLRPFPGPRRRGPCPLPNTSPPQAPSSPSDFDPGHPQRARGCTATRARAPRREDGAGGSCPRSRGEGGTAGPGPSIALRPAPTAATARATGCV